MKENLIQINGGIMINVDASMKNIYLKKIMFGILLHLVGKMDNYLANIMYDSVIMWDEIIEETKPIPTNFNEKKVACKTQDFYSLRAFLLITITLLIAVSMYCYLIKYRVKQKHLLPFHVTNNELKEIFY